MGFRPHVLRTAHRNLVSGWVRNAGDGVEVHAEGDGALVTSFLADLEAEAPAAALIEGIFVEETAPRGCAGFEIAPSVEEGPDGSGASRRSTRRTHISPDLATCPDCLRELNDPADRRFHYPFANCTNCGPRFTIIDGLPYDRPRTSMRAFEMCPSCADEYGDEADRRFHAQPDACFLCGPSLSLALPDGQVLHVMGESVEERRGASDRIIGEAVALLRDGKIVAIKGLGGYHLACDARDDSAVRRLRQRKGRLGKPFAVMVRDVPMACELAIVVARERELLESPAASIVLLGRKPDGGGLAESVCSGLAEVGVMLPATPLQHLLLEAFNGPLVMTSGNLTTEPIAANPPEAHARLHAIADAFLDNDREIVSRYDDSVLRVTNGIAHSAERDAVQFVRRARGYAPEPLPFPRFDGGLPAILGAGAEQKATFSLVPGDAGEAIVSQYIGDLERADSLAHWIGTLELYESIFGVHPSIAACDLHPDYLSSKWVRAHADRFERIVEVQHHHAHIAAVIGEHLAAGTLADAGERVIGIALDGTGCGTDGTVWGGEVLVASARDFERFAHLVTFPLVGGEAAIREPLRQAYGLLARCGLLDHPGAAHLPASLGRETAHALEEMLAKGIGCIETSSAGRLFDAMSALLGICTNPTYDAEAPMLLEATLYRGDAPDSSTPCRFAVRDGGDGCIELDPRPVVEAILDGVAGGTPIPVLSRWFHESLGDALILACGRARASTGLSAVALSGGVLANRFLRTRLVGGLADAGFTVLEHLGLPPNDGCISYGQAVVAASHA